MQLDPCGDLWCFASLQMTGAFVTGCMLFTLPRGKHCDMSQFFFNFIPPPKLITTPELVTNRLARTAASGVVADVSIRSVLPAKYPCSISTGQFWGEQTWVLAMLSHLLFVSKVRVFFRKCRRSLQSDLCLQI